MREKIAFIVLALFVASLGYGASLTLIQPNGGELCLGQDNYPIRWTASGVTEKVKLVLFKDGVKVASIAENLEPGGSPYLWKVGQYMGGTAAVGGGYKVRVRTMSNTLDDFSDAFFSLKECTSPLQQLPHNMPGPTLKLESPNGGENWRLGSDQVISWSGKFMTGKVQLQLYRHPCCAVGVIAEDLPATGTFTWKAGKYLGNTAPAGQYNIRVISMANHEIVDMSDQPFTLTSSLADVVGPAHAKILKTNSLPGVYLTFPGSMCFPSYAQAYFPQSEYQAAMAAFNTAACRAAGVNTTAMAGIHWVTMSDPRFKIAAVYRSRIHFNLNAYAGQGGNLASATLKMKRVHAIDQDANCSAPCACSEVVAVLKAVMTSFDIPGSIGQNFPLPLGQAEFTLDVTDVVKQWLDGTLANHGLVLMTNELPCSNCDRLCISCYEASLVLKME